MSDGTVRGFYVLSTDITKLKQAEEEKAKLQAKLRQTEKMESVGRLAGGVAHDFNNMMAVILGFAELSKMNISDEAKIRYNIEQIVKAVNSSITLTRQLLTFSRKEIISPKPLNINSHVVEAQKNVLRLIGEDINLAFNPEPDIWTVNLDPSQLDQVLVNLAVNSRDAMPNGGEIRIETENVRIGGEALPYNIDALPGDYIRLSISDSGTGMDRKIIEHIFEPFFTTKESGKGTGLGLSTVYGIVSQNNGYIALDSELGKGTTFHIFFPRHREGDKTGPGNNPEETIATGSGTLLLVEDDEMVRIITRRMLEEIGYLVIQAETPQKALDICEKGAVPIDLVLTDVVMPMMNGREMAKKIKTIRPDIKVLFMSGYADELLAQRGVLEDGTQLIQKPFNIVSLSKKIGEMMTFE